MIDPKSAEDRKRQAVEAFSSAMRAQAVEARALRSLLTDINAALIRIEGLLRAGSAGPESTGQRRGA